ncbi:hypothetical protein SAMN05444063_10276 [Pseudomonas syringae]|nr:hypothetical protein SAMN05444063_10276 [Pseudomonas syringae]
MKKTIQARDTEDWGEAPYNSKPKGKNKRNSHNRNTKRQHEEPDNGTDIC